MSGVASGDGENRHDASQPEPIDRRDIGWALLLGLVAVAFQWPIHDRWLSLQDEGYILAIADDLNRGKLLYRDVTADAPFPGAFYLLAWWFRWTTPSVESTRILAVGGFALYVAALYRIAREVLSRRWCFGLVLALLCYRVWAFPHWHIYSYSLVAAVFLTIAAALIAVYLRTQTLGPLVLAGLLAGAGIMSKQNYGLAVTGALGLMLLLAPWVERERRPGFLRALAPGATLGIAAAAVVVPTLWWFASQGAWEAMVDQTWRYPFDLMNELSFTTLPNLWPLWGQDADLRSQIGGYFPAILATLWWYPCTDCFVSEMSRGPLYQSTAFWDVTLKLVYWAPLLLFGLAAALWGGRILFGRAKGPGLSNPTGHLLVLALAGGFLLAFNKPRDWVHLMMVYPPILVVGAALAQDGLQAMPPAMGRLGRWALGAALGVLLLLSVTLMIDLRRQMNWPLLMDRGGVYADRQNGPLLQEVHAYMDRSLPPTAPLPVYPVQPMIGFLAGRETAAGYYVVWPAQSEDRDEKIIADFAKRDIQTVIYSVSQFQHLRPFRENAPELYAFLLDNFAIDRVFVDEQNGPILLGLRREPDLSRHLLPFKRAVGIRARDKIKWSDWPFAKVLTSPVGRERRFAITVPPEHTVLGFSYGVNPDRWLGLSDGPFRFRVTLEESDSAREHVVFESTIDPARVVEDRRWHPARIDLSAHAGELAFLRFTVTAEDEVLRPEELVGWQDPFFIQPGVRLAPLDPEDRVPGGPRRNPPLPPGLGRPAPLGR